MRHLANRIGGALFGYATAYFIGCDLPLFVLSVIALAGVAIMRVGQREEKTNGRSETH